MESLGRLSKHEQLVMGVINAIDDRILISGNQLPSVNRMIHELKFARNTIVKAYSDLKDRGIVEARKGQGYFVMSASTDQTVRVALLLYALHPFQEIFYNTFRAALGDNIQLDVFFHHNNLEVFENTLLNIKGRYGMYVVAPMEVPRSVDLLRQIPENKLLIVDRKMDLGTAHSFVAQEFEQPMYKVLQELNETIRQFDRMVLLFRHDSDFPIGLLHAFERFTNEYNIQGEVVAHYVPGSLEKGTVYLTIGDIELWEILKDCVAQKFELGKDIGILSHNDSPVKEIICGGITTFSTDFRAMAQGAAEFVLNRTLTRQVVPSLLRRRKSL
ncbi:MAG: GntR family transcriptional regulator [Bacteroidota bacterium]